MSIEPRPEHLLLTVLRAAPPDQRVYIVQSYIAEEGPVPDDIGDEVKRLMTSDA